jgi:hypothetical protein
VRGIERLITDAGKKHDLCHKNEQGQNDEKKMSSVLEHDGCEDVESDDALDEKDPYHTEKPQAEGNREPYGKKKQKGCKQYDGEYIPLHKGLPFPGL